MRRETMEWAVARPSRIIKINFVLGKSFFKYLECIGDFIIATILQKHANKEGCFTQCMLIARQAKSQH